MFFGQKEKEEGGERHSREEWVKINNDSTIKPDMKEICKARKMSHFLLAFLFGKIYFFFIKCVYYHIIGLLLLCLNKIYFF